MRWATLLTAILMAIGSIEARGQDSIGVKPGSRVRIHSLDGVVWIGTLMSIDSELARLTRGGGDLLSIQHARIERIQVSIGRERTVASTMLKVGGALTLFGGVFGAISYRPCVPQNFLDCYLSPNSRGAAFLFGGAAGGVVGLPLGLLIGLHKRDIWRDAKIAVPAAPRSQFSLTPVIGSGVGFVGRFSVSW